VSAVVLPLFGVFLEQTGQQGFGVRRERSREADVLHQDELEQTLVILVIERQPAAHHLVHHHSQTPPVHRTAVVVVLQHLHTRTHARTHARTHTQTHTQTHTHTQIERRNHSQKRDRFYRPSHSRRYTNSTNRVLSFVAKVK